MPRRLGKRVAAALLAAVVTVGLYGWLWETAWIEVTRHSVSAPIQKPLRLVQLTDLHLSSIGRRERRALEAIDRERPDAIVITGDLVRDGTLLQPAGSGRVEPEAYAVVGDFLRGLRPRLGTFVVRGNWEHWRRVDGEKAFYAANGARLLVNEAVQLDGNVWLAGLDDALAGLPDPSRTRDMLPSGAFVVALVHSPIAFEAVSSWTHLVLAGHTHGGQIRIPFLGPLALPPGSGKYASGWFTRGRSRLYVSRGIGTAMIDVRLNCRPEIAIFDLQAAR